MEKFFSFESGLVQLAIFVLLLALVLMSNYKSKVYPAAMILQAFFLVVLAGWIAVYFEVFSNLADQLVTKEKLTKEQIVNWALIKSIGLLVVAGSYLSIGCGLIVDAVTRTVEYKKDSELFFIWDMFCKIGVALLKLAALPFVVLWRITMWSINTYKKENGLEESTDSEQLRHSIRPEVSSAKGTKDAAVTAPIPDATLEEIRTMLLEQSQEIKELRKLVTSQQNSKYY